MTTITRRVRLTDADCIKYSLNQSDDAVCIIDAAVLLGYERDEIASVNIDKLTKVLADGDRNTFVPREHDIPIVRRQASGSMAFAGTNTNILSPGDAEWVAFADVTVTLA